MDFHLLESTMDKALKSPLSFRTQYKFNCLNQVKEKIKVYLPKVWEREWESEKKKGISILSYKV